MKNRNDNPKAPIKMLKRWETNRDFPNIFQVRARLTKKSGGCPVDESLFIITPLL
jgi:hypothetical protein